MKPAQENNDLLTTDELAAKLKLHPSTIRADRAAGNTLGIPYTRIGRTIRYRSEDVAAYLENNLNLGA